MKRVIFTCSFTIFFVITTIASTSSTSNKTDIADENLTTTATTVEPPTKPPEENKNNEDVTLAINIETGNTKNEVGTDIHAQVAKETRRRNTIDEPNTIIKIYNSAREVVVKVFSAVRVSRVFRNIGTCAVNGVMEIVSYYVPAPFIPLLASAAGILIPFEPVVTLRHVMPVNSYRRALSSAVNTFMGTFEKFKVQDEDPYMTRRFNRRFMNDKKNEKINDPEIDENKDDKE